MTLSANWYRDGTATSLNGSQNIVGAGTLWSVQARKGDLFAFLTNGGISKIYEIDTVTDNTHIILKDEFYETSVDNGDYVIIRNFNTVMTSETNAMLVSFLREWKLALQNNFKGDTGDTGEDGNTIYSQSGVPSVALGKDGDFCVVTTTWNLYKRVAGAWVLQGGLKGANGTNGYTVHRNNGVPSSALGVDGDWCIDYAAWDMYYKSGGAWVLQGSIKGADGTDGNTVLSSNGIPDVAIGVNDDWCLDYANWNMYRKESGAWVLRGSVKGETGTAGAAGAKWYSSASDPSSAIGITGDYALNTTSGDVFKRGAGGWTLEGNLKGNTGATGAQGPQGATGATGATGTAGSRWHTVSGIPSTALGVNTDMALDTVTSNWYQKESGAWVQKGNIKGATGDTGAKGDPGIEWKGEWVAETVYAERDAVYRNGSAYLALQASTGQTPPDPATGADAYWAVLSRKGTDGEGAGDMTKEDYDSDADGKVNAADTADTATYATTAGRATVADSADAVAWENVLSKPTDFTPSAHALDAHNAVTLAELNAKISDATIPSDAAATTSAAGLVQLATDEETATGTNSEKGVTPSGVAAALAKGATVLTATDLNSEDYCRHGAWVTPASGLTNLPSGYPSTVRYMMETIYLNSYVIQTIFALHAAHYGKCATRVVAGTVGARTFGPWEIIYNSQNILGTVSQSSGVPTGAIIERGSNANGEYVKFADGTQICNMTMTLTGGVTDAAGAIYTSSAITFTVPATFASGSLVNVFAHDSGSNNLWVVITPVMQARAYSYINTITSDRTIRCTAIGRWF